SSSCRCGPATASAPPRSRASATWCRKPSRRCSSTGTSVASRSRRSRTFSARWACRSAWTSAAITRTRRRRRSRASPGGRPAAFPDAEPEREEHGPMRHRKDHRKLSRTASHRKAVLRNLVTALFQYERIETTVAKAKEARRMAERLITFGKQGDLAARRHVSRFVTRPAVVQKLFSTIAPWYTERHGGYTRIVRIGRRLGDAGEIAYLELMKTPE